MNTRALRADVLLLITAIIWGFAFVAQRAGMEHLGPFAFNGIRFALGSLSLLPLWLFTRRKRNLDPRRNRTAPSRVLLGGAIAGTVLFLGASLQQIGLVYTTAGKAGFITGLYVVLVPILGLFLRHRVGAGGWSGAILAAAGLYLLSVRGGFRMGTGDLLVFVGALFWAAHVLVIGRWTSRVSAIELAALQFAVCSVLSLLVAAFFETTSLDGVVAAAVPIIYGGVCSVGVAFTLQVVAQRDAGPAATAVLLSLESVFAALGGWALLDETMTPRGILGCGFMLAGVLLSQLGRDSRPPDEIAEPRTT